MLAAGIDVSLRRGQTIALLDGESFSFEIQTVQRSTPEHEISDAVDLVRAAGADVVAVDSPLQPSLMLLRDEGKRRELGVPARMGLNGPLYANYRVCDYELIRRGMPLYQVGASREEAAGWMKVGFRLATALLRAGFRLPLHHGDIGSTLIEVFPDAAFVTLMGARPARKSGAAGAAGREQRRAILAGAGIDVLDGLSHDDLDSIAAALTALRWGAGQGCAVGDVEEGLIVLPVRCERLLDRYRPVAMRDAAE